mmetsp:Transcript_23787/g.62211  ORF Transcript_23787/g.62211 Transcript_23787/m.62211 type:complete len:235 (+) Transcript_23787:250-954(+)
MVRSYRTVVFGALMCGLVAVTVAKDARKTSQKDRNKGGSDGDSGSSSSPWGTIKVWAGDSLRDAYQALPSKEAVRQTVVNTGKYPERKVGEMPCKEEVRRSVLDSAKYAQRRSGMMLDALPTQTDMRARAADVLRAIQSSAAALHTYTIDAGGEESALTCPHKDVAHFDAAFETDLTSVRNAETCKSLLVAIKELHKGFSFRRTDVSVPACASLSNKLDKFNRVATTRVSKLCT